MTRYAVLVRGVNVGGHNRLPMADLRAVLSSLGHGDVVTYLQSGNAVFTGEPIKPPAVVEREIEAALHERNGLAVTVMVRTIGELARVVAANPLPEAAGEPALLHVAFLAGPADTKRFAALDLGRYEPDQVRLGERALYLWYRNGAGRAKLSTALLESRLGTAMTARNWNTVTKLLELGGESG